MLRLTTILCAAIYLVFVIYGDPARTGGPDQITASRSTVNPTAIAMPVSAGAEMALAEAASDAPIIMDFDAVLRAGDIGGSFRVGFPERPAAQVGTAPAETADILVVTGSRVNLRAGPSTNNPVIVALTGGTRAQMIEELPNGWMRIRTVDNGVEGYMSGTFLAAADT